MEDEETEKVQGMVAPKPSFVPRKMQMGGEAATGKPGDGSSVAPAGTGGPPAPKKAEVVYTPASDALLEVSAADNNDDDNLLLMLMLIDSVSRMTIAMRSPLEVVIIFEENRRIVAKEVRPTWSTEMLGRNSDLQGLHETFETLHFQGFVTQYLNCRTILACTTLE